MLKKFGYLCELIWKFLSCRNLHETVEAGLVLGAEGKAKANIYWYSSHGQWFKLAYIKGTPQGWNLKWQLLKGLAHEVKAKLKLRLFGAVHDRCTLPYRVRNKIEQRRLVGIKPFKFRKKYIIALPDVPESLAGAELCMQSAERFGEREGMEIFPGINRYESEKFFKSQNLTWSYPRQGRKPKSMSLAEMGCFASHYLLWKKCVDLDEPVMVLEDDVKFQALVPALRFRDFIYLGKLPPYVGKNVLNTLPSTFREVYHPFRFALGSFAYGIGPRGARKLLSSAQKTTVCPVDNFVTPGRLHILFYRPQPVTTSTRFSSIRKTP